MKSLAVVGAAVSKRLRSVLAWLGLVGLSAAPVAAQTVPPHWISYAQLVGQQLQNGLGDSTSEAVVRLHAWMQGRILSQGAPQQPVAPLIVRVWVSATGYVERVDFHSLGDAQADADLRGVLMAQSVGALPPKDMRQPLVLQLALDFK